MLRLGRLDQHGPIRYGKTFNVAVSSGIGNHSLVIVPLRRHKGGGLESGSDYDFRAYQMAYQRPVGNPAQGSTR